MTTERIEAFWRDATAADVARVMAWEVVDARFRNNDSHWEEYHRELRGCKRFADGTVRWFSRDAHWAYCQVYDPPQWWLEKPEPGEGYRLLAKFPEEDLQPGDEAFAHGAWWRCKRTGSKQGDTWYRRKVEQPKPEPKHYKLNAWDTADLPSGHRIIVTDHGIEVQ